MYVCSLLLRYSYVVYVRECYGTCIYSTNGIATVRRYLYVLYLRYACTYCYAHTYILTHPYLHIATLPIGIHSTCFHILYARYCYGTYFYVLCLCTLQRRYEATYVCTSMYVFFVCTPPTYIPTYFDRTWHTLGVQPSEHTTHLAHSWRPS